MVATTFRCLVGAWAEALKPQVRMTAAADFTSGAASAVDLRQTALIFTLQTFTIFGSTKYLWQESGRALIRLAKIFTQEPTPAIAPQLLAGAHLGAVTQLACTWDQMASYTEQTTIRATGAVPQVPSGS